MRWVWIDGKPILWKTIQEARREQRAKHRLAQPTLFPLIEDKRPEAEQTAKGRYEEPTLMDYLKK